ncbi:MAG: ankyrin repeat domain-containing protein, partial [Gemmatimonadaceae bacterium]
MPEHPESLAEGADPARDFAAAVQADDLALVRAMLDQDPALRHRLNDTMPGLHFGGTPLIAAVNNKNREMVELLLGAGADVNQKSHWWAGGFGVLDYAVDLADFLISRGATLDACSAARLGRLDALSAIVRADPRRVHERGGDGKTPLHWAATIETAEFLLENGADIDARDVDHESTPLQYLIREHQDVARLLVARWADADIFAAAALGDLARAR